MRTARVTLLFLVAAVGLSGQSQPLFDHDVKGLGEKDAMLIRFGRGLFRDHKVSSEL
jgi:hypothetical protein